MPELPSHQPPEPPADRARLIDLLDLPEALRESVRWLQKQPCFTLEDLSQRLGEATAAEATLAALQKRGLIESLPAEEPQASQRYRLRLRPRRRSSLGDRVWQQLEDGHE